MLFMFRITCYELHSFLEQCYYLLINLINSFSKF